MVDQTEIEKYDSKHGTYKDAVDQQPIDGERLPTNAIPKAPEIAPFKVGESGKPSI